MEQNVGRVHLAEECVPDRIGGTDSPLPCSVYLQRREGLLHDAGYFAREQSNRLHLVVGRSKRYAGIISKNKCPIRLTRKREPSKKAEKLSRELNRPPMTGPKTLQALGSWTSNCTARSGIVSLTYRHAGKGKKAGGIAKDKDCDERNLT